jgi:hypothetical protein
MKLLDITHRSARGTMDNIQNFVISGVELLCMEQSAWEYLARKELTSLCAPSLKPAHCTAVPFRLISSLKMLTDRSVNNVFFLLSNPSKPKLV